MVCTKLSLAHSHFFMGDVYKGMKMHRGLEGWSTKIRILLGYTFMQFLFLITEELQVIFVASFNDAEVSYR